MSGPRSQPRCKVSRGGAGCGAPIKWIRHVDGGVRKYDPKPVDGRTHVGAIADPVENGTTAWRLKDLIEDLRVRNHWSTEEAEEHAYAMEWYVRHQCRPSSATSGGDQ